MYRISNIWNVVLLVLRSHVDLIFDEKETVNNRGETKKAETINLNYSQITLYLRAVNFQGGAEFGDMTQILRNLGSCPRRLEFGAICEYSYSGNEEIHE